MRNIWYRVRILFLAFVMCVLSDLTASAAVSASGLIRSGYASDGAVTLFNYSPTLVQTTEGLLVAWIGASGVDSPDASVYLKRNLGGVWSQPKKIASTIHKASNIQSSCQRPVLFKPVNGPLMVFYQSEDSRSRPRSYYSTSSDNGRSWIRAKRLPATYSGPARVKPIQLPDGPLLCGGDSHSAGWSVHIERAAPFRQTWGWSRTRDLTLARMHNASEPVLLNHGGGHIQALCRTKRGYLVEGWSNDNGESWDPFERTALPNPDGGLDVVKWGPQDFVLVYQHSNREKGILNLARTRDGKIWSAAAVLENQPGRTFSDPAMVKGADGNLHLVYCEDQKRIKYLILDPAQLASVPMVGGNWPY